MLTPASVHISQISVILWLVWRREGWWLKVQMSWHQHNSDISAAWNNLQLLKTICIDFLTLLSITELLHIRPCFQNNCTPGEVWRFRGAVVLENIWSSYFKTFLVLVFIYIFSTRLSSGQGVKTVNEKIFHVKWVFLESIKVYNVQRPHFYKWSYILFYFIFAMITGYCFLEMFIYLSYYFAILERLSQVFSNNQYIRFITSYSVKVNVWAFVIIFKRHFCRYNPQSVQTMIQSHETTHLLLLEIPQIRL